MLLRNMVCMSVVLGALAILGCGTSLDSPPRATSEDAGHGHEHAHASQGPHGGGIVELGTEDFHAEIVHNEQEGTVTVYLLDSTAKQAASIDAAEISINLRHDGKAEQFKLPATPVAGEPDGSSSRFVSTQKELADDLDQSDAHGQLVVTIGGKQYRGNIEHDHDHDHGANEKH